MKPSEGACASSTPNSSLNAVHNPFPALPVFQTKKFRRNIRNSSTLESWKENQQCTLISWHTLLYLWLVFYEWFLHDKLLLCLLPQAKRNNHFHVLMNLPLHFWTQQGWNHITVTYLTGIKMIIWTKTNWNSRLTFATVLWYSVLY